MGKQAKPPNIEWASAQKRKLKGLIDYLNSLKEQNIIEEIPREKYLEAKVADLALVLLAAYLERAIQEILFDYIKRKGRALNHYFEKTKRAWIDFDNDKLCKLLKQFNPDWELRYKREVEETFTKSLNTVNLNRNQIAHGGESNLSFREVEEHFKNFDKLVDKISEIVNN